MLNLGRGISEYEDRSTIPLLWEEPEKYAAIFEEDFHIISGRKGSGKSTIVDYKEITQGSGELVIVIRPTEDQEELYERVREISAIPSADYGALRQALAKLFEYVTYVLAMRRYMERPGVVRTAGDGATIYTFLAQNDLLTGSAIKKALDQLAQITNNFVDVDRIFTLLQKLKPPTFQTARDAFLTEITRTKRRVTVFIDDIDGFGFEYSPRNKAFLDALVIHAMSANTMCARRAAPFRVIVTPPTELFDNARFWNSDKILTKTVFLRWSNLQKLENLINKRISAELKILKRKQRYPGDVFSIDTTKTWDKIFPAEVYNRVGTRERTLDYMVRHTFYTPRNVLAICQNSLERLEESGHKLTTLGDVSTGEWATAIQGACEEKSNIIAKNVIDIYTTIYPGIDALLEAFEGRPNVWKRSEFREFVRSVAGETIKAMDTEESVTGDHLLTALHRMGFLGYGFESPTSPAGARNYDVVFSYLSWTSRAGWDLAVVSPVFYDSLRIQPMQQIVVSPHGQVKLSGQQFKVLERYNRRTNAFV